MTADVSTLIQFAALAVFVAMMLVAAIGDVRTFRIPNKLNLAILGSFLVLAIPLGLSLGDMASHGLWFLAVSAICLGLFFVGVFGGGDAKMIGAVSIWLGPAGLAPFVMLMAVAGGVLAALLLAGRAVCKKAGLPRGPRWLRQILRRKAGVPYGVAIAVGALLALPSVSWVTVL